jgi:hypothetical protein
MRVMRRDPELASLSRRLCSGCLDASWIVGLMAGTLGATIVWDKVRERGALEGLTHRLERWTAFTGSPRWQRAGPVVSVIWAVGMRNSRSPGMRVMHIRRADAHTGGPVTARAALVSHVVGQAQSRLVKRMAAPRRERHEAQIRAIQDEIDAARRQHPDDSAAQQQAVTAVYRAKGVTPFGACSPAMFAPAVLGVAVTIATPRHQAPSHWIAGIVTVRD